MSGSSQKHEWNQGKSVTGRGTETVCDWFIMCREVCTAIVSVQNCGQMVGIKRDPVQIDKAPIDAEC